MADSEDMLSQPSEGSSATVIPDTSVEEEVKTPEKKILKDGSAARKENPKKPLEEEGEAEDVDEEEKTGILDGPLLVEGKRVRHKVERLTAAVPKPESPKPDAFVGKGNGMPLGEIASANEYISTKPAIELKKLHKLLFLREGQAAHAVIFKRTLRQFNGWWFDRNSPEWKKRMDVLKKMTLTDIKHLRSGVGLNRAGANRDEEIENLMHFLDKPSGKSTDEVAQKKEKTKKRKSTGGAKTPAKKAKSEGGSKKSSKKEMSESDESEEEPDDDATDKTKKKTPKKRAPQKQTPKKVAKKKAKKAESDTESDADKNEEEGQEKDGEETDSSDSGKDEKAVDEDPKHPSDISIERTIKELLKTFDLSQVSMKQMCQAVCDKFPGSDLEERKIFLKEKIKVALSELE